MVEYYTIKITPDDLKEIEGGYESTHPLPQSFVLASKRQIRFLRYNVLGEDLSQLPGVELHSFIANMQNYGNELLGISNSGFPRGQLEYDISNMQIKTLTFRHLCIKPFEPALIIINLKLGYH
jgi:hypothetical protein